MPPDLHPAPPPHQAGHPLHRLGPSRPARSLGARRRDAARGRVPRRAAGRGARHARAGAPSPASSGPPRAAVAVSAADSGFDPGRVVVVSSIDNLLKGAASQAVQNLNLMLGLARADRARAGAGSLAMKVAGLPVRRAARRHQAGKEGPGAGVQRRARPRPPAASPSTAPRPRRCRTPQPRLPADRRARHPGQQRQRQRPHRRAGPEGRGPGAPRRWAPRSASPPESTFTASTGVIGVPLPVEKIIQGLPRLVRVAERELRARGRGDHDHRHAPQGRARGRSTSVGAR